MSEMLTKLTILISGILYVAFYPTLSLQQQPTTDREVLEYCQWEIFNATCSSDEVILMTSARYGRMQFGRCMREDHGSAGCAAVVLPHLDQICSGRHSCQLNIPDVTLHSIHPCPKELMPYLEASYSCIPVQSGSPQFCATQGGFSFNSQTSGFLSSVTAVDTSIGLSQCPWLIEVKKGQRINLTLYSFSTVLDPQMMGRRPSECEWTVVVQEGNLTVQLPGCSLAAREKVIYTTQGGNVKVHLEVSEGIDMSDAANIILKYQVFGCPDISVSANTAIKRHGDTTMVTCLASGQTDVLTCFNDRWMGELVNCSKGSAIESGHVSTGSNSFPYGMLLVVGIGILMGIVLGVIMLFGIIICLRRRRRERLRSQTTDPLLQKPTNDLDSSHSSAIYVQRHTPDSSSAGSMCAYHHLQYHQGHRHHHFHHQHHLHHSSDDILGPNTDVIDDLSLTPFPLCVVDPTPGNECLYERWMTSPSIQRLGSAHPTIAQTTFISNPSQALINEAPTGSSALTECPQSPIILDVVRSSRASRPCPHHQTLT